MIPMDSMARDDSVFSTMGPEHKEFPEVVYSDRPPAPITPESYTVNLMGLNSHKDPTIEQYVRVHMVYAAARYKISDLVRAQDTDKNSTSLEGTCQYPKTRQDSSPW